jgi:putative ABC transport system ATP-binding protein
MQPSSLPAADDVAAADLHHWSMTTTTIIPTAIAARAEEATKVYGSAAAGVRALDSVTLAIPSRRWTAIMGPSGSGKSTLLHCMAGLDSLTAGRVLIGEQDLAALSDEALTGLRRQHVGFMFQAFNLVPTLSAGENITLPFTLGAAGRDAEWIERLVDLVGLADRLHHRPSELSGGQQQRVAVARALVTRPELVFADEPTGNLDSRASAEILGFLRSAVDDLHQTVVLVTHDPAAAAYADEVVFLADGTVVDHMAGPTAERVLDRMKQLGETVR